MTQISALALTDQEIDFELEVCRPDGSSYSPKRLFNDSKQGNVGWHDGLDTVIERGGACKLVTFSGRKDLLAIEDAEIVRLRMNDGRGWNPVGFGAVVTGHAAESLVTGGDLIRQYEANTEELLKASVVTGNEFYQPQDVAAVARQLAAKYRHPALGFDGALMPNCGYRLDEPSEFLGMTLLKAFEELAKKVEAAGGRAMTYGAQADGKLFFKLPTGEAQVLWAETNYKELPIDLKNLCTAVDWIIGNTPSVDNYSSGAYSPAGLSFLAIPDAAAHTRNPRILPLQTSGNVFVGQPASAMNQQNFTDAQHAWDYDANGGRVLGNVAYLAAGANMSGYLQIVGTYDAAKKQYLARGLPIYGAHLRYRMVPSSTVGEILEANLALAFYGIREDSGTGWNTFLSIPLLFTADAKYQELPLYFPPPTRYYDDAINTYINPVGTFSAATVNVKRTGSGGSFSISDFRFMCLNTSLLMAAAQKELKQGAVNPAQLQPEQEHGGRMAGRFIGNVATVVMPDAPGGLRRAEVSEIRHGYTRERRYRCFVDVGNPTREGLDATLERVATGIDTRIAANNVLGGKRLGS